MSNPRAANRDIVPFHSDPMLATLADAPFHLPGWVYEEKYDGCRILAHKEGDRVSLLARNGLDRRAAFPDVAAAVGRLAARACILDGEVVAFDAHLRSRFQLLQQGSSPRLFAAFDCIYLNGRDLRFVPLRDRRREVLSLVRHNDRLFPARRLAPNGFRAFEFARRKGLEGLIAKDGLSSYVPGRSLAWRKVKVHQEEEFVIGGFAPSAGSQLPVGTLLLGAYDGPLLRYVGQVAVGLDRQTNATLVRRLRPLVRPRAPFVDPPRTIGTTWLQPEVVAQIEFGGWTEDLKLRHPTFLGLRDDKSAVECRFPTHASA